MGVDGELEVGCFMMLIIGLGNQQRNGYADQWLLVDSGHDSYGLNIWDKHEGPTYDS